jgi:hypothetical protein
MNKNITCGFFSLILSSSVMANESSTYLEVNKYKTEQKIENTFQSSKISYNFANEGLFEFEVSIDNVEIYNTPLSSGDIDLRIKIDSLSDDYMLSNHVTLTYSSLPFISSKDKYLSFKLDKIKDIDYKSIPDLLRNQVNILIQEKVIPLVNQKLQSTNISDLNDEFIFKMKHNLQYVTFEVRENVIILRGM